jgi:probable HAF family extracellular repeat protein
MNARRAKTCLGIVCVVAVAATRLSAQQYEVVDLGTLGGNYSGANGISENGMIAGWATDTIGKQAVIWDQGGIADLGEPAEWPVNETAAVNDAGQAATFGEISPQAYQSYFWDNGVWTPIGVLPGLTDTIVTDIDSAGRVIGRSLIVGPGAPDRSFIWEAGVMTELGTLGGYTDAHGMNEVGQVVGASLADLPGGEQQIRAFLWEDGEMTGLNPLPGDVATEAFDVNESGEIVGSSWWYTTQFFSAKQATLWRNGGEEIIDLGYVPAPPYSCSEAPYWHKSIARAINNSGQIVGEAMCIASGGAKAAFLWEDGVMYNLNDLIPSGGGWELLSALDINDAGQIVGFGLLAPNDQYLRAYLLEPLSLESCGPGDLDNDGDVDLSDFNKFQVCFGLRAPTPQCPDELFDCADLNDDGWINLTDFSTFQVLFGTVNGD